MLLIMDDMFLYLRGVYLCYSVDYIKFVVNLVVTNGVVLNICKINMRLSYYKCQKSADSGLVARWEPHP